jgi:hypothetical protein
MAKTDEGMFAYHFQWRKWMGTFSPIKTNGETPELHFAYCFYRVNVFAYEK